MSALSSIPAFQQTVIMHDFDLSQRLRFAESDFLTALESGTNILSSYYQTWSKLPDILHAASRTGAVDQETLSLAYSVASRIANLASCFIDIKRGEESYTTSLQRDCDTMVHQMASMDLNARPKSLHQDNRPHSHFHSNTSSPNAESLSPPFLSSVHQWLLDNLHNPYPTAEVKAEIAAASSCQVSSVSSWFINARRRIGWTTLCREHFSNCRADMIDAAYRAFVEEDPQRILSPELRHSFVAMKVTAERLYSSTFSRSALAGDLDAIIKDMTVEHKEYVEVGKHHQIEQANLGKTVRDPYPSPDRSIAASPVSALDSVTDEREEEEDVVPPMIAGSKRRRELMEPVDQAPSTAMRPMKRLRASMPSPTHLPSPPSSTDGIDVSSDDTPQKPPSILSIQSETDHVQSSREWCLSDPDSRIPNRQCGSMLAPRINTASEPLPQFNVENESSIGDWFHTNFDALFAIPPPVDATMPDSSLAWEVELFRDYSIPGNPKCTPVSPPAQTADDRTSTVTDFSDFDGLLQSIGNTFPTTPSSLTAAPYMTSLDSPIPDMSQPDIDWASLLNGSDTYQSTIHSTFPQCSTDTQPLPEINLSMLQLPHAIPPVNPQDALDFASKQAKLHQFHAMQEAVRRMEQELQSAGVIL